MGVMRRRCLSVALYLWVCQTDFLDSIKKKRMFRVRTKKHLQVTAKHSLFTISMTVEAL